jgi:hypothetical protein
LTPPRKQKPPIIQENEGKKKPSGQQGKFMPATWNTDIGRVQFQPSLTNSYQDPMSTNKHGIFECAFHPHYMGRAGRRIAVQVSLGKMYETLYLKDN